MKNKFIYLTLMTCGLLTGAIAVFGQDAAPNAPGLKYGLYIHFGMDTFRHPGEKGRLPVERFAPTALDVKSWAHTAKLAGMTFAILTAKHETGFCLWDSQGYDYDIAHSPVKGDLLADFIAACKAEGLVPGVHYSIPDAYNEGAVRSQGDVPPPYFNVIKQHLTELNTKYPELRIIRLDGSCRLSPTQFEELTGLVKRLNPQCAVWTNDKGSLAGPESVSDTVNKSWMWSPNGPLKPAQQLFNNYNQCQAAGKAFVLNVGPDTSGNIPGGQIAILMQVKSLIASSPPAAAVAPAPDARPSAADRLKQLKSLYDQGLINKDDYDQKVKQILDSM
jgi:alpha-L-fucosidase